MPITANDLRWFRSERMTDNDDGGGQMTSNEIFSGQENQIFDDLSDVDRAAGDVSIRKVYAAVASADDAKYLDAGVVVLKAPADPKVSVTAFSTGDYYDEREDLANRLESGIARGPRYNGYLWGQHIVGQRAIVLWQRESASLPSIGARLELAAMSGTTSSATVLHSQVVWVTEITEELVERVDAQGPYRVRMVVCELAEPLRNNYTGTEPERVDISAPLTMLYETRYNHDVNAIVGIAPLAEAAEVGDFALRVSSLYTPLIPTAFAETALADVNPGGDALNLVATRTSTISFTTALNVVAPDKSLFLGSGCYPGTLVITQSGTTITDDNGTLRVAGADVGRIDYGNGVCYFNASAPSLGTNTKTVTFRPACSPIRVADTDGVPVTVENRGLVWVYTLSPIPAPGTLRVAYQVNGDWYVLSDKGNGQLTGADSSYGQASLNFSSGTVVLTCGQLPDVDSEILFSYATPIAYFERGGSAVDPIKVRGQTTHGGVEPGSVTISWPTGNSLTDNGSGAFSGAAGTGQIDYTTGEWWIVPATVPAMGTEFTVAYSYGEMVEESPTVAPGGDGYATITFGEVPLAGSIRVEFSVQRWASAGVPKATIGTQAKDDGVGGWIGAQGTVDYAGQEATIKLSDSYTAQDPVYSWREVPCGGD